MPITVSLAAVAVADLAVAKEFYGRLFGRPADLEPMPSLAQWDFPPSGGFQVVENAATAGASMATLLVSDFDDFLARSAPERNRDRRDHHRSPFAAHPDPGPGGQRHHHRGSPRAIARVSPDSADGTLQRQ